MNWQSEREKHMAAAVSAMKEGKISLGFCLSYPAAGMIEPLRAAGARPLALRARDVAMACADLYDGILGRQVRIVPDPAPDAAAAGAVRRPIGDAWAWGRRRSTADITPLCAITWALWVHRRPVAEPTLV